MFTLPAVLGLIIYILVRPFDFLPALKSIPFLHILTALAVVGFALDVTQRHLRWKPGPNLPWVVGLFVWAFFTVLVRAPGTVGQVYLSLVIPALLYFLIAHGLADLSAFAKLAGTFLACTLVVSAVCVHLGLQPFQCVAYRRDDPEFSMGTPEGYPCTATADCYENDPEEDVTYSCEQVGLVGLTSVGQGRVRYLGILADPNESTLAVDVGVPLAIARFQRRRSLTRLLVLALTLTMAIVTGILAQSRGGQLVFLAVLGTYFVSRYRWKGLVVAALVALPVMMYGVRTRSDADESTMIRLEAQWSGIWMIRSNPIIGVGHRQYTNHASRTAHNSYVLAPAEIGLPGMAAWAMVFWISIKSTLTGLRVSSRAGDEEGSTWGIALLATLVGLAVGVFFLTLNYHYLVWTIFGMAGAYYAAVRNRHPETEVHIGFKDLAAVTAANLGLLGVLYFYMKIKGVG